MFNTCCLPYIHPLDTGSGCTQPGFPNDRFKKKSTPTICQESFQGEAAARRLDPLNPRVRWSFQNAPAAECISGMNLAAPRGSLYYTLPSRILFRTALPVISCFWIWCPDSSKTAHICSGKGLYRYSNSQIRTAEAPLAVARASNTFDPSPNRRPGIDLEVPLWQQALESLFGLEVPFSRKKNLWPKS